MLTRQIGRRAVVAVGLGCAPISVRDKPDELGGTRTILAALEGGVTLIDTADVYNPPGKGAGHSEVLVSRAVALWSGDRDSLVIATKGGKYWGPDGQVVVDGRPSYLRAACEASLQRLETEAISLYFLHEPDPQVPFAESVGALADLQREGKIELIGVSNVSVAQLETARSTVTVAAVQNRYSPVFRENAIVLDRCTELGIAFLPWGPLNGMNDTEARSSMARRFESVAQIRGISPQRLAIAWALAQSAVVIPIPGATRPESIRDDMEALSVQLTEDEARFLSENDAGS